MNVEVPARVTMTCMTTKQKFDVERPEVVVLNNGRYAYKADCPWKHPKTGMHLKAFKFCSTAAYKEYHERVISKKEQEDEAATAAAAA